MDLLVLEAIAEVRVERKEYNQPSVPNNAKRLGRTAIVLVDLGQTARELVKRMKNGVREGELDERGVGEDALHLAAERGLDPEVVVHPQEPARREVAPQVGDLVPGELHVAMTAGEHERVLEHRRRTRLDDRLAVPRHGDRGALAREPEQVGEGGSVLVPVAAPAVLEARDSEAPGPGRGRVREQRGRPRSEEHEPQQAEAERPWNGHDDPDAPGPRRMRCPAGRVESLRSRDGARPARRRGHRHGAGSSRRRSPRRRRRRRRRSCPEPSRPPGGRACRY